MAPRIPIEIGDEEERRRAVALLDELEGLRAPRCQGCQRELCGHHYIMSTVLGFKQRPRCVPCLGEALAKPAPVLVRQALEYIDQRPCFQAGWHWADDQEGTQSTRTPDCLLAGVDSDSGDGEATSAGDPLETPVPDQVHGHWDAGDMSCGDLVFELRLRLSKLAPHQVLALKATDPAAPEDIPAWCGLTGHTLLKASHPNYLIRRKDG